MKVVISTDIYYPMINGVAVFARNLAGGLQRRGHEVMVLAPSITGDYGVEKDEEFGFTVVRLSSNKMHLYPDQINDVPEAKKLLGVKLPQLFYKDGLRVSYMPYFEIKRALNKFKPDIIHDQTPGPIALAVYRYAKHRGIPLVATDHAYPDNLTQQVKLPSLAKKPINKAMNAYILSFLKRSEYATMPTEQAVSDLVPKNRKHFRVPVEALSNGIDLSRFKAGKAKAEIYERYDIPKNKKIVLYIGRVDPEKSLDVLVRAFGEVCERRDDVDLVMVGDGTAKNKLEKLTKELNIAERVHFLGRVVGDDLPELYRTGDVFAITSKTETQSIVLMEAMASGLPAVAVRAGAIHELVKSDNGFLCEPDDEEEIAESLLKIIGDDEMRKKMAEASLERIKIHDINYTLKRFESIYAKVLRNRRSLD